MQHTSAQLNQRIRTISQWNNAQYMPSSILLCNWQMLREQLLSQWTLITPTELDITGANCCRIADLIAHKYGLSPVLVENYLRNFERTMPLL